MRIIDWGCNNAGMIHSGVTHMTREFIRTTYFDKYWDEMKLSDDDLRELENHLLKNPGTGDVISGAGGAIKLRWALPSNARGKSAGIRIIYVDLAHKKHTHLLLCYPKTRKENLTAEQKQYLKKLIAILKGEYGHGKGII